MNEFLLAAGVLAILIGLIHSVLGELLIFKHLRVGYRGDNRNSTLREECPIVRKAAAIRELSLSEGKARIVWGTWHLASIFGGAMGAILIKLSASSSAVASLLVPYIVCSMAAAGLLILVATKGRHPGWIGLCAVAVLCLLA